MAITVATPEEELAFKRKSLTPITQLLPFNLARSAEKNRTGRVLNFGLGDIPLQDAPPFIDPKSKIFEAFADQGVSILDPRHPLGLGGGSGEGSNNFLDRLLQGLQVPDVGGGAGTGTGGLGGPGSLLKTAQEGGFLFGDIFQPPERTSDKFFENFLASVSGPSSIEEVQKGIETDALQQVLDQIDRDTAEQLAGSRLDIEGRGLGGPGQLSELETSAAAGIRSRGGRSKAQARTSGLLAEIERQKAREALKSQALGRRFEVGAQQDIADQGIAAQGASQTANILANLLGTEFQGGITLGEGEKNRSLQMFNSLLNAVLTGKQLDQNQKQFMQDLLFREEQGALNRDLTSFLGTVDSGSKSGGFLSEFLDIGSKLIPIAGGIFGRKQLPAGEEGRVGGLL